MLAFMAYPSTSVGTNTATSSASSSRLAPLGTAKGNHTYPQQQQHNLNAPISSDQSCSSVKNRKRGEAGETKSSTMMEMEVPPETMMAMQGNSVLHLPPSSSLADQDSDPVLSTSGHDHDNDNGQPRRSSGGNLDHSVIDNHPEAAPPTTSTNAGSSHQPPPPQPERRRRTHLLEKLYENTVDGPCQTVTLCEVQQMDLFLNCQQPLSFLGFGGNDPRSSGTASELELSYHLPASAYYNDYDEAPIPGAYSVPRGCEYCGAPHTSQCVPETCRRPRLYFCKKRPPFCPPDASLWDPETDEVIRTTTTTTTNTATATTPTKSKQSQ